MRRITRSGEDGSASPLVSTVAGPSGAGRGVSRRRQTVRRVVRDVSGRLLALPDLDGGGCLLGGTTAGWARTAGLA
ncbi:hypothetical protein RM863_03235 [Streptomyces sp. DSM 41014]|uniref:Uncharacterized protein n=1 Tax=Streptomyces hintoniae TaxID=3075521 RepID=A0ABU2UDA0_9ACTN|nr:hypothetical protein [Streptomyces sp. DSM 41014]MDT0471150.1 hypothetical protein [Streptomyces sp. DSM 41014]